MTQIAAETLGLPIEDVTFKLGDSSLPQAPVEGGSLTAASVGSAVKAVCEEVREKLFELARKVDDSPLADAELDDVTFADGHIRLSGDPSRAVSIAEAMRHGKLDAIEEEASAGPSPKQSAVLALRALGGLRGGEGRRGPRHDPRHARRQRRRRRPHPEPEDGAQPGPGRRSSGASAWRWKRRA